jgi:hypothetical protein
MLTFSSALPPVRYSYQISFHKPLIRREIVGRKSAPIERFLDAHLRYVDGTLYYGTNTRSDYLLDRRSPLFLTKTPPSNRAFVIEFPISLNLIVLDSDSFEELQSLLQVQPISEVCDRLEALSYKGFYYNSLVALSPQVRLPFSPSYRKYLYGNAQLLPETAFVNYQ